MLIELIVKLIVNVKFKYNQIINNLYLKIDLIDKIHLLLMLLFLVIDHKYPNNNPLNNNQLNNNQLNDNPLNNNQLNKNQLNNNQLNNNLHNNNLHNYHKLYKSDLDNNHK